MLCFVNYYSNVMYSILYFCCLIKQIFQWSNNGVAYHDRFSVDNCFVILASSAGLKINVISLSVQFLLKNGNSIALTQFFARLCAKIQKKIRICWLYYRRPARLSRSQKTQTFDFTPFVVPIKVIESNSNSNSNSNNSSDNDTTNSKNNTESSISRDIESSTTRKSSVIKSTYSAFVHNIP